MDITSTAGIAFAWAAMRADADAQARQIAILESQADADQAAARMLEEAVDAAAPSPPDGQGGSVDIRV